MNRIPFGVNRLDELIDGGAPPGSVVLLAGEAGAGSREFLYTSAVMNGLARAGEDLFDLHYGETPDGAELPDEIHYISFTGEEDQLREEVGMSMDAEIAETGLEPVRFKSLSQPYFDVSPVPRSWYAGETPDLKNLRQRHENRAELLSAFGNALSERAPNNLVVVDSLSDLVGAVGDDLSWSDITYLVSGLQKAAYRWQGLILLHVNHETLTDVELGQLMEACSGTLRFQWETGGSTRARTLVVKQFSGVLSQIEEENIVQFEAELGEAGFDISDVRKIR